MRLSSTLRILDANLNRAREALRVMEEFARFSLEDAGLTAAIKDTRHSLTEAARQLDDDGPTIRARDILGDVGCAVATASEFRRGGDVDVASAGCKRLSEALRVIEEYGKTIAPDLAARIEKIRYRGYELERRLLITAQARERLESMRLYVMITEAMCRNDWFAAAEAALRGGAEALQLREKELDDRALVERGKRLAKLCHEHDALFIVNDRPDVASACGADGVHLGQDDLPVAAVRGLLSPRMLIGVSTHNTEQVQAAAEAAPDYIAVGPMFPTETKPQDTVAGPATLATARALTSLPLIAIGGINEHNVAEVLSAARCGVCVCATVIARADVESATRRVRSAIDRAVERPAGGPA